MPFRPYQKSTLTVTFNLHIWKLKNTRISQIRQLVIRDHNDCTLNNNTLKARDNNSLNLLVVVVSTIRTTGLKQRVSVSAPCREKRRDLTQNQSYDKTLTPTENSKKQSDNTRTSPKTSITLQRLRSRLRTISLSNDSHPAGMVKLVYVILTFHLTTVNNILVKWIRISGLSKSTLLMLFNFYL